MVQDIYKILERNDCIDTGKKITFPIRAILLGMRTRSDDHSNPILLEFLVVEKDVIIIECHITYSR